MSDSPTTILEADSSEAGPLDYYSIHRSCFPIRAATDYTLCWDSRFIKRQLEGTGRRTKGSTEGSAKLESALWHRTRGFFFESIESSL